MSKPLIVNKQNGKYLKSWRVVEGEDTKQWSWRLTFWRLELELTVYRHQYPSSSDRWVFKPSLIYDRKSKVITNMKNSGETP